MTFQQSASFIVLTLVWLGAREGNTVLAGQLQIETMVLSVVDQSHVAAEEAGVVTAIDVHVGQQVQAGTPLGQLDDRAAQLAMQRARIEYQRAMEAAENDVDVRAAKEGLSLAELDLRRARESISRYAKSVSDAQIGRLEVMVARARLEVEQAERDLRAARLAAETARNDITIAERGLERRRILAPIGGTVVDVQARLGEWVDPGQQVVRIVSIDRLRAEGFVEFARIAGDVQGQEASFNCKLPNGQQLEVRGVVTFVSPEVNRVNGQVHVWAEIDNQENRLRPGLSGTLTVLDTLSKSPSRRQKVVRE